MSGRITAKADGAQCSIASPRLLLTARDKPLSQLFTLRRVFLELELHLLTSAGRYANIVAIMTLDMLEIKEDQRWLR